MIRSLSSTLAVIAVVATAHVASANILVSGVNQLSWVDANGASSSVVANAMTVQTSKNSSVTAALPQAVAIPTTGDFLSVSFDVTFDHAPADAASYFVVGFGDSANSNYFYKVAINPLAAASASGTIFSQTGDTNLGKYATLGFGTVSHNVVFTVTKIATAEFISLTAAGDVIDGTPRTVGLDITPGDTTLNTVFFEFSGAAWNEDFGGSSIVAVIDNFTVSSNVPEPATMALLGLGGLLVFKRR